MGRPQLQNIKRRKVELTIHSKGGNFLLVIAKVDPGFRKHQVCFADAVIYVKGLVS